MKSIINPKVVKFCDEARSILENKGIELSIDLEDSGVPGDGKPVILFIHGNSTSKKVFHETASYFATRYRIIALDLPGHGKSSNITDLKGLDADEKDTIAASFYDPIVITHVINQLLTEMKLSKVNIVGWSLGGHFAYALATLNPDIVHSIVTIDSPPVMFNEQGFYKGFYDFFPRELVSLWISDPKHMTEADARGIADYCGYSDIDSKNWFFIEDNLRADPLMRKFLFLKAYMHNSKILDGEEFVRSTQTPICLITGQLDSGIRADYIKSFAGQFKNTRSCVHLIDDAKHAPFVTHHDEFYNVVSGFLRTVNA